jgi:membrane protease YdiL (CAAX protease family)
MRRLSALLALMLLAPLCGALDVPEGGLPAGRLALGPIVSVRPAALGNWTSLQNFLRTEGASLPGAVEIAALDPEAGRYAAAVLPENLSLASYPQAQRQAAAQARENAGILGRLQTEIDAGRVGVSDLEETAAALRGLSVYDKSLSAASAEVSRVLEREKSRTISSDIQTGVASWNQARATPDDVLVAAESRSDAGRLESSKKSQRRFGRALTVGGVLMLGASAAAILHPQWAADLGQWPGIAAWAGAAFSAAGRFFSAPRGPPQAVTAAADAPQSRLGRIGQWLSNRVPSFRQLYESASKSADAQRNFEAKVGDASWPAFKKWLTGAARTALYWFPLALAGMLGGSVLSSVPNLVIPKAEASQVAHAASTTISHAQAAGIVKLPFMGFVTGYIAESVVTEVVLAGAVYNGFKWLSGRIPGARSRPALIAGVATMAAYAVFLSFTGIPAAVIATMLGIQAVVLYAYERSGSLWAAAGMQAIFALMGTESTRMLAWLNADTGGALHSNPEWSGLVVAGLIAAAAGLAAWKKGLKTVLKAQWDRLKEVGEAWARPVADGAPKSPASVLKLGLFWALPVYLSMYLVFGAAHYFLPQAEPTPEILKRMILMPFDVIVFNFMIVAGLEEWVFRKGVFKPIVEKLKKWVEPSRSWFWPAAIASSLIFSGAHYIDFGAVLAHWGIGHTDVSSSLGAGAYAFTWASFLARAAGGMMLAFLYARSGLLLIPMIAHFGSNVLESIGMKWGLAPFLVSAAAVLALQFLKPRPPAPKS